MLGRDGTKNSIEIVEEARSIKSEKESRNFC